MYYCYCFNIFLFLLCSWMAIPDVNVAAADAGGNTISQALFIKARDEIKPDSFPKPKAGVTENEINAALGISTNFGDVKTVSKDSPIIWPNGLVYFNVDPSFTEQERLMLAYAMISIEKKTCLFFESCGTCDGKDFIHFTKENGKGCTSSNLGKKSGRGQQVINLQTAPKGNCWNLGIVSHELLHALGIFHESARPDRDQFLKILVENLKGTNNCPQQFQKHPKSLIHGSFSPDSVMFPMPNMCSKNKKPTLALKNNDKAMALKKQWGNAGQRNGMTAGDLEELGKMYKCDPNKPRPPRKQEPSTTPETPSKPEPKVTPKPNPKPSPKPEPGPFTTPESPPKPEPNNTPKPNAGPSPKPEPGSKSTPSAPEPEPGAYSTPKPTPKPTNTGTPQPSGKNCKSKLTTFPQGSRCPTANLKQMCICAEGMYGLQCDKKMPGKIMSTMKKLKTVDFTDLGVQHISSGLVSVLPNGKLVMGSQYKTGILDAKISKLENTFGSHAVQSKGLSNGKILFRTHDGKHRIVSENGTIVVPPFRIRGPGKTIFADIDPKTQILWVGDPHKGKIYPVKPDGSGAKEGYNPIGKKPCSHQCCMGTISVYSHNPSLRNDGILSVRDRAWLNGPIRNRIQLFSQKGEILGGYYVPEGKDKLHDNRRTVVDNYGNVFGIFVTENGKHFVGGFNQGGKVITKTAEFHELPKAIAIHDNQLFVFGSFEIDLYQYIAKS